MRILLAAAILPALLLLLYVYKKDRIEKEPKKLITKLFLFGGLTIISAMIIELTLGYALSMIMTEDSTSYIIIHNFLIIAGAEEGGKYLVLKSETWNSPSFDYSYDAVVYAVSVSLGFAAFENVLYVLGGGLGVALLRAVLSIPGHAVFSVYMGYYYGLAKKASVKGNVSGEESNLSKALIVSSFLHGFYDFCLTMQSSWFILVFFVFFIAIVILAFRKVNKLSYEDAPLNELPYYNDYYNGY